MQTTAPSDQFNYSGIQPSEVPPNPLAPPPEPQYVATEPSIEMPPPQKKKSRLGFILFIVLFLIIISAVGVSAATVYTNVNLPYVSQEQRKQIVRLFFKVPFIPKTAEQVLLGASEANSHLTTYNPEFSLSASMGTTAIGAGSADLKVKGPIDFSNPEKFTFDLDIDLGVNVVGSLYTAKGHLKKVGETVYGKMDSISENTFTAFNALSQSLIGAAPLMTAAQMKHNLDQVFVNWVSYDTKGIESEARKQLQSSSQNQSLIDSTQKNVQKLLLDKTILVDVKLLPEEDIEGVKSYHVQFIPTHETLKKIYKQSLTEEQLKQKDTEKMIDAIIGGFDSLQMDAWYGQADLLQRKMTVVAQINLNSISQTYSNIPLQPGFGVTNPLSSIGAQKLNLSVAVVVRDIGKVVAVTAPTPVKSIFEYGQLIQDALKTEERKKQDVQRGQFDAHAKVLSGALLKYYVDKGVYPPTLTELKGTYIQPIDLTVTQLDSYLYRLRSGGKKYVLFIESPSSSSTSGYTPYYGITSEALYPRQLMQNDFD